MKIVRTNKLANTQFRCGETVLFYYGVLVLVCMYTFAASIFSHSNSNPDYRHILGFKHYPKL